MSNIITQTQTQTQTETQKTFVLKLRASVSTNIEEKHVTWDEKVINNEHMNKKKSKNCCIFCKKKYDNLFVP